MASKQRLIFLSNIKSLISLFNRSFDNLRRFPKHNGMLGMSSMDYDLAMVCNAKPFQQDCHPESLSEIFGRILHMKVPRNRRTVEKRLTRKHSEPFISAARPKKNIVTCLVSGQSREAETICGKWYAKVREETEEMRKAMTDDVYYYDHPRKEVAYLYRGEKLKDFPKYKGRYIVEMEKERPSWFPLEFSVTKKKNGSDGSS